jgi:hypothetical protein
MSLQYTVEKLRMGVAVLATQRGRINERLIAAFHRSLHAVSVDSLPDQAKPIWAEVWTAVTAVPALGDSPQDGAYAPSIRALDEDAALRIAEQIVTVESMASHALDSR